MASPRRHQALAAIAALLLAAAPAAAMTPCHCPPMAEAAAAQAVPVSSGCHAAEPAPDAARDADAAPSDSPSAPCQGSCGSCATIAALAPPRPIEIPTIVESRLAPSSPARRPGESRPPDHVPLPL